MSRNRFNKRAFPRKRRKDDDQTILMKASLAHREGRLAEAEKGYRTVLQNNPQWGQLLNALGTVYIDLAQPDKARNCFKKAAHLTPPHPAASYNLARLMQQENDHEGAAALYIQILEQQPEYGEVWNNLGIAYRETGDKDEALSCFQRAVTFAPEMAEAWNNLGVAQDELEMYTDSSQSYSRAIELRAEYTSAHFNLGCALQKLRRYDEAAEHYAKVLAIAPKDKAAKFMLHSLGRGAEIPDAAPAEHVRRIFDQCADSFEKVLVHDLQYKTPELLFELVRPYLTEGLNVLDLGCGTGLGALFYRPYAARLTGVDISPKMLAKAAEKELYDDLQVFDILQNWPFPQKFDLIYSSDVFVYFGDLNTVIQPISSHLAAGGITAFSVEKLMEGETPYQLDPSGRYAHSRQYIAACLEQHDLLMLEAAEGDIRKQSGKEVKGLLIIATKR